MYQPLPHSDRVAVVGGADGVRNSPCGGAADRGQVRTETRQAPLRIGRAEFAAPIADKSALRPATGRCGIPRHDAASLPRGRMERGNLRRDGQARRTSEQPRDSEEAITALASVQHGVVARNQLLRAGVPPDVVDRRLKAGRLRAIHRGVYLVGPLRAEHVLEMAAVLACGESGVLSHRSAAVLWQLVPRRGGCGPLDVSTLRGDHGRRTDVRVHRVSSLRHD